MRKLTLLVILFTISTFAQKDELKTLKRLYDIASAPSEKDIVKYNQAIAALDGMSNLDETQKNEYNFYKGVQPLLDLLKVSLVNPESDDINDLFTTNKINNVANNFNNVLNYENKINKYKYRDEIKDKILPFIKPYFIRKAYDLNSKTKYQEASELFYAIYNLDKSEGVYLENAAVLAVQSNDKTKALKYYQELKSSDYLENGRLYYATNMLTNKEELLNNKVDRDNRVLILKTHEKPREEKVSVIKKPLIYKNIAILLVDNDQIEEGKKAYKEAKLLNPDDIDLLIYEANLYLRTKDYNAYYNLLQELLIKEPNNSVVNFSIGEYFLIEDVKIVDEINNNLNNDAKYNELSKKRKEMYEKALPYFEKAYSIDPKNANNINFLRATYNILGMSEKADKL
ncbi:hypothetical protein [Flavobacterium sp.]|uniref:tetratricopeptide repeat protein n=1 Tax=Flavobacterium sp. TaxID=239 RepID=UPI003F6A1F16